jgi:RNA recognition motif-containing protein
MDMDAGAGSALADGLVGSDGSGADLLSSGASEEDHLRNLIVNYIPQSMSEADLKSLFEPFGSVESCKLMLERGTGKSLGYGFVKYETIESANAAIDSLSGMQIENKKLKVSVARPATASTKGGNLYVSNLDEAVTQDDLKAIFSSYGNILETKVLYDRQTQKSRQCGFVRFSSKEEADRAIGALNNVPLPQNGAKPIYVKVADSDGRKNANQQRGMGGGMMRRQGQYNRYDPYGAAYSYGYQASISTMAGQGASPYYAAPQMAYAQSYGQPQAAPSQDNLPTLFVYNIPNFADENLLYQLFSSFGPHSVRVVRDEATSLCKGYGFVSFVSYESAQQAIISMNGFNYNGKTLQVSFRKSKA